MKYTEKYPNAVAFDVMDEMGVSDYFGPCAGCQDWTYWYSIVDEVFMCGEECFARYRHENRERGYAF
jgi:hypothetical protein